MSQPEVWLRGPIPAIPALLQPVAHGLIQCREELTARVTGLTPDQIWARPFGAASTAKTEAKEVLSACAKQRQMIPYSEFVTRVHSIHIDAHDPRLAHFLEEISTEGSAAGRGMLTALVVHKRGDLQPGPGRR